MVGVPLGTWIGAAFGWRATFLLVGALGLGCLALTRAALPQAPPAPPARLSARLRPLRLPAVLGVLLAAVLGNLMIQTYLAVFLRESAAVNAATLGALLALAGIAGTRFSGALADRLGAGRAFAAASAAFAVTMAGLAACWWLRPVPPVAVVPALLLWSAVARAVPPPVQTHVLALAGPDDGPQVMALTSSAVYIGASLGGAAARERCPGGRCVRVGGAGGVRRLRARDTLRACRKGRGGWLRT
ncbi:MFS transporter [Actinomadura kijaniata]|uniref:MFS transporter n=1 Tax=Actinomadura kijaniata TaxID=46161 RepID=UPI0008341557|nr:MFS transporter [Actinomadura kijaniata]